MSAGPSALATPLTAPTSAATHTQALQFMIAQALARMQTTLVVEVQAVHGGGLGPVGTVDVLPLVDQIDGAGNAVPHVTIFGRPYVRWQGGANAVILDPAEGDLGVCCFASRDISAVIASKAHGPPPSNRKYNFADGLYMGGTLNGTPTSYLQWEEDGTINCTSPVAVNVNAPTITLTGGGTVLKISAAGIELDGILWETHYHPGVQSGGSNTGPPE
jgi:hypothetical protein